LDYDAATATISTHTADSLLDQVKQMGYEIDLILETHAHADHITAASYLQKRLAEQQGYRPLIGIGRRISQVQEAFRQRYSMDSELFAGVFDKLFEDDEVFHVGSLSVTAIHIPGHTPDHMGYKFGGTLQLQT
jgi:glyoxylase-like metal-dependent hydrolase (beta-lactamase superfamily II)